MRLALRTILCAGLLTLLLVPLASAQGWDYAEMITYNTLMQAGTTVYAYAYSDLYHPDPWASCPANQDDCWNGYSSDTSLYLTKNGQQQAFREDVWYGGYSEVWTSVYVDAGEWALETEHDVDVEWEDWYYQLWYYPAYDWLHYIRHEWLTINPEITISSSQGVDDGGTGYFNVWAQVGTPTSYLWSFEATSGAVGNDPNVNFSSPYDTPTLTDARWYAYPNGECTAQWYSTYWITATVGFPSGPVSDWTYLWVNAYWNPAGQTVPPTVQGTYNRNLVNGEWKVTSTNLWRTNPGILMYMSASSQFYYKMYSHEEKHRNQFQSGMLSDLYNPADLHNLLIGLTAPTEAELVEKVNQKMETYYTGEAAELASREGAYEREAYGVSDQISPQYLYQICGRFQL